MLAKLRILVLSLGLLVQGCASASAPVLITGGSYVFVEVLPHPTEPRPVTLLLARYDAATRSISEWSYFYSIRDDAGADWYFFDVPPGDYVLYSLGIERNGVTWLACFDTATYAYRVEKSEAVFLGRLDATPQIAQLTRHLEHEQRLVTPGIFVFAESTLTAPNISVERPSIEEMARLRNVATSHGPISRLPMRWEAPTPATF